MKTKILLCGAAILLATGCQRSMSPVGVGDVFPKEEKGAGNIDRFAAAQAACGARTDGMLFGYDFYGDKLNSLGREKLDLILCAPGRDYPVMVYLAFPADDHAAARKQAVTNHLMHECALRPAQFQLVNGYNPDCSSPAGPNIDALNALNQAPAAGAAPAGASSGYGAGSSGGGSSGGSSSGGSMH